MAASSIGSVANDPTAGIDYEQNAKTTYAEVGSGTTNTDVYLTVDDSDLLVGVPTTLIVSGTPNDNGEYVADYSVRASGDMSGDKVLTVKPQSNTVELKQTGKEDEKATITQSKTKFTSDELTVGTQTTGKVVATGLTAGSWKGSTNFVISCAVENEYTGIPVDTDSFKLGVLNTSGNETTETRHIISSDYMQLKYGDVIICPSSSPNSMTAYSGEGTYGYRVYIYDNDNKFLYESSTNNLVSGYENYFDENFVVTQPSGIKIKFQIVHWNTSTSGSVQMTKAEIEYAVNEIKIYNVKDCEAPVFDTSSVKQEFENSNPYEAWAIDGMIYNTQNKLYYFFYNSGVEHMGKSNGIYYRTSSDCENWTNATEIISSETDLIMFRSVLLIDGVINVFYNLHGDAGPGYIMRSANNGTTWTTTDAISVDGQKIGFSTMITQLDNGTLVTTDSSAVGFGGRNGVLYSTDKGSTWKFSTSTNICDEAKFVQLSNGKILCIYRTSNGLMCSYSDDNCVTWSASKILPNTDKYTDSTRTPCDIIYNKSTDRLEIYYIDRVYNHSFNQVLTLGRYMCNYIDGEEFIGFNVDIAYLGSVSNMANVGYPEMVELDNGKVKAIYYNDAIDGVNTTSFFSMTGQR